MPLSPDQVLRIATLSRIELDDAEGAQALAQLNRILQLVGELEAADTNGIEPMAHPSASEPSTGSNSMHPALRLREDRVTETDRRTLYQSVAPQVEDGLYLVPRVIE
jgi:aspartyl-tRNA(Asn)/glutamyl-tRNA(Gln) amidotransferase subunit C